VRERESEREIERDRERERERESIKNKTFEFQLFKNQTVMGLFFQMTLNITKIVCANFCNI
jgi:hypothetical protein